MNIASPWGGPRARPRFCSLRLLCGTDLGHTSSVWEMHSSLAWKVHSLSQRGAAPLYRQKSLPQSLMGRSRAALIGQNCTALIGWGKPQSCWLKLESWSAFIQAGRMAETRCRQGGDQRGCSSEFRLRGRLLCRNGY